MQKVSSDKCRSTVSDIDYSVSQREDAACSQGELLIDLPAQVSADALDHLTELVNLVKADGKLDDDPPAHSPPPVPLQQLPTLHISIDYQSLDPNAGAIYYGNPNEPVPVRDPVYMLTDSRFGMARFWMPCVDSMKWCDRYLFDMDISVSPRLTVIASGELATTLRRNEASSGTKRPVNIFKYCLNAPAHASEVVLAVGPFVPIPDPALSSTVTHFCLPGLVRELVHTSPPLFLKALAFCRDYFGSDPPCNSLKNVFVGSLGTRPESSITGAGGIVVHSADVLHNEKCIDEGFTARKTFMNSLVEAYLGRFLRPRSAEDRWLIQGLASHVSSLGLQLILGHNWYRFRIQDMMELLQKEKSCDLSDVKLDFVSPEILDAVRRRSHIIVYMVERKIGEDVMKRALRDIIAEGKRTTVTAVKSIDETLLKPVFIDENEENALTAPFLPDNRELKDLNGNAISRSAGAGVVSSGFDEVVQGVAVGPFLKRIRAICGTDVRHMVRQWASSPGIPRLHIGYQYNARKHTIEFVVKQDDVKQDDMDAQASSRPCLPFHGSINIRVRESEGAYDHTIEITEAIFTTEVQCHSRRPKTKPLGSEKDFVDAAPRGSSVSWIRFDPDHECCKETIFHQQESSWASMLTSERDAIGQYEACRGLMTSSSEKSTNSLLSVLKDPQIYWRVRAEAATVLASSANGLERLIKYFRSCYTDSQEGDTCVIRPNNFSNVANYFVKRAMIRAIAGARLKGSYSTPRPEGSVPVEASQFLCRVLSGHDNAGNDYDDDHYVIELLKALANVAIVSVGDSLHQNAGEEGNSTTESIIKLFQRFQSLEQMEERRSSLVNSTLIKALCDIERAKLMHEDKSKRGAVTTDIRSGIRRFNPVLFNGLFELSRRECTMECRVLAMSGLLETFGGNSHITRWVMTYIDRSSIGLDTVGRYSGVHSGKEMVDQNEFTESPIFRTRLLESLHIAASQRGWYGPSPILQSSRAHSKLSIEFCHRLSRLAVGDSDPRTRLAAMKLMKLLWGSDVPVCLLSRDEYAKLLRSEHKEKKTPVDIAPVRTHSGVVISLVEQPSSSSPKSTKPVKPPKNGKTGKVPKHPKSTMPLLRSVAAPLPLSKTRVEPPLEPIDVDAPVLRPLPSSPVRKPSPPPRPVLPPMPLSPRAAKMPRVSIPRSVVVDVDKPVKKPERTLLRSAPVKNPFANLSFPWHPMDKEDAVLFNRAWQESKNDAKVRFIPKSKPAQMVAAPADMDDLPQLSSQPLSPSIPIADGESMENGDDLEHKKKKKKKKRDKKDKKRKRHRDDEDRKKSKKKKRDMGEYDGVDDESYSMLGSANGDSERAPEDKKIGKIQIKLPSRSGGQLASAK